MVRVIAGVSAPSKFGTRIKQIILNKTKMIKNRRSNLNETPFKAAQITPEMAQKNPTILPSGVQGTASP